MRRARFERSVRLTGELRSTGGDTLFCPAMPEWRVVIRWLEQDGAPVIAGQRVVELDNAAIVSKLDEQRLAVSDGENELQRQQASAAVRLADAGFELERRRIDLEKATLLASVPEELLSRRDWHERQLSAERARVEHEKAGANMAAATAASAADVEVARIALARARSELGAGEVALQAATLLAPRSGILQIGELAWEGRTLQVGDSVWAGYKLASIPDLAGLRVEAALFDVDDGAIEVGDRARCSVDAFPTITLGARVTSITPVAQEPGRASRRRAFSVVLSLEDPPDARMLPGMSVRAEVMREGLDDALLVPRAAVVASPQGARALLAGGGEAAVRLGPCSAHDCVVLEGLADGARLRAAGGRR